MHSFKRMNVVSEQKNLLFADLSPDNLSVADNGYLQLTQFGPAEYIKAGSCSESACLPSQYVAPEVKTKKKDEDKTNRYRKGIIPAKTSLKESIMQNKNITENARELLNKLLTDDPKERLKVNNAEIC
uniref:Protein kinase domain-containing protein n=1 Tax=Ditylenchus dipsaci TaxID=166011 RepID=A0A915DNP5_9BILA